MWSEHMVAPVTPAHYYLQSLSVSMRDAHDMTSACAYTTRTYALHIQT